ncbi:MAG: glutathione S-transferase N-terminal domain-containing protein [Gammaproteobacteria bacterium]|jgi:glutaredoxin
MKWIIKGVREGLGRLIILIDFIFSPKKQQRTESDQEKINEEVKSIKLYQFYACPFCIKTRRAIKRLNLPIETRNAQSGQYRAELLAGGGEVKVPCLKIESEEGVQWMYESTDIIQYLEKRFS